ncbi:MAG: glycoside hydrolase [Cocleimonas sp.]|nr:glycoside hydrolase [Cocleimonas sp.]
MHQPYYREGLEGKYQLPWVYLHGIKDYTDMATHLENHPKMRAVVNFSPILLEQLDDYVTELERFLNQRGELRVEMSDPLLALLTGVTKIPADIENRRQLVEDCKRCYAPRLIDPYPAFKRIVECLDDAVSKVDAEHHFPLGYLEDQYFIDLLMWYHLAWLGHSLKQTPVAQRLMKKEHNYTLEDRYDLLELIYEALAGIIPRYKKLAEQKRIELSMTPYAHPIIPLLNNFGNMVCSLPFAPAPNCDNYPDGMSRSYWHMQKGIEVFEHYFGQKPKGVWLSEGGLSPDAIQLLDKFDISWTASGEDVWRNTCNLVGCNQDEMNNKRALFKPYQYQDTKTKMYFRDDGLSDFIGFEYSHWNAQDAAHDFVGHLQNIDDFLGDNADEQVVSVILDGENAWEYYIDNGYHFLDALYEKLSNNPQINLCTFEQLSDQLDATSVDQLCSGSWVYGSFSTWIGQDDKNRAWEYLVTAKHAYDEQIASEELSSEVVKKAELQLAICEGSDWFWWFGDYNSSGSVSDFDILFRTQLKLLYEIIKLTPPETLEQPISFGGGNSENSGTMRRNK